MKRIFRFPLIWAALACLLALLLCLPGLAVAEDASIGENAALEESLIRYVAAPEADVDSTIGLQTVDGVNYLFLPASADLRDLRLEFSSGTAILRAGGKRLTVRSGAPFDLTALIPDAPEDGRWELQAKTGDQTVSFTLMRSSATASLFLTSPDAEHDRSWIELDKSNKAKGGGCLLLRADGSAVYDGTLKQLKGRGNSTWNHSKRPYQIKLSKAADLIETGLDGEANGTWVLLADFEDATHLHNRMTFALAEELGLAFTPHCRTVDLWYDGEYRGQYLLCEKTEVGTGRVDIRNLEAEIEELNKGSDALDKPQTAQAENAFGNPFQYVEGLVLPEDYSAGYLLELDYEDRAMEELCWFRTTAGMYLVVKSPEALSEDGVRWISERYQRFEDAVMSGDGAAMAELADLDSLARVYLIMEYANNRDAYLSSTYFYLPADGILRGGPVWDFDNSYIYMAEGFSAAQQPLGSALVQVDAFRDAVLRAMPEFYNLLHLVLGDGEQAERGSLRALADWEAELADGWRIDQVLWTYVLADPSGTHAEKLDYRDAMDTLESFLRTRLSWLVSVTSVWDDQSQGLTSYLDVPAEAPFYDDVVYVREHGIFQGVGGMRFAPYGELTRAMAVTVLYRMAGQPESAYHAAFTDVAPDAWYDDAVAWATETGLVVGYEDGSFRPDVPVSHQEFLLLLYRSVGSPKVTNAKAFEAAARDAGVGEWAVKAMAWALQVGIRAAGTALSPYDSTLRHEAASFLAAYDRLA